ncbi:MAG: pyruvate kinase [Thaumarchaeota archaeon]|nr:pyruvate kinase [Nitrososphaerota archaeon]MCL5316982.1 pyruvate kinase [Nitrososphaerota archaeon]
MNRRVRAKTVCTIGPACRDRSVLRRLIQSGLNVARLNFSHGTLQEHTEVVQEIRRLTETLKMPVAVLQDLPGPKIRVGIFRGGSKFLKKGEEVALTVGEEEEEAEEIPVDFPQLPQAVAEGDSIYLADGTIRLKVLRKERRRVLCRVVVGGTLLSKKGLNIPNLRIKLTSLSPKDQEALLQGLKLDVDFVGLSFVEEAEELLQAKSLIKKHGGRAAVIAKIERKRALNRLNAIVDTADGVMVARGDLGVEIGVAKVPAAQKRIIRASNAAGKPVITATQLLETMVQNPYPTRAEVADITTAILDGTDALMLSEETAVGRYPVEALQVLLNVAQEAEKMPVSEASMFDNASTRDIKEAMGWITSWAASHLKADAIVAPTRSGFTALQVAKRRPAIPIVALTPDIKILKQLLLACGVYPYLVDEIQSIDGIFREAENLVLKERWVQEGDRIVIVAGDPGEPPGITNLLEVRVLKPSEAT